MHPGPASRLRSGVRIVIVGLTLTLGAVWAAPARAHGDIRSASPEEGSKLRRPPREVALVLAEPPAAGSSLVVTDGCKDKVSGEPVTHGDNYSVAIEDGRPGRWAVKLRSISSVDGHVIKAGYSFTVAGK